MPGETVRCTFTNTQPAVVAPAVVTRLPTTGAYILLMVAAALAMIAAGL